uniref:Putative secreted salivary gland peptide n=2 Tax=Ixodes ricinus TaxID=34613 RepID=A0A090X7Y7_IXORI
MLRHGVLAIALVACAHSATVHDANNFVDTVLTEKLPPLVRASLNLFPVVRIPFFKFRRCQKLLQRTATSTLTLRRVAIRNLDIGVRRMGECQVPAVKEGHPER